MSSRSKLILEKSIADMFSAIEMYNKLEFNIIRKNGTNNF